MMEVDEMRAIVCGGRDFADQQRLWNGLEAFHKSEGRITALAHDLERLFHHCLRDVVSNAVARELLHRPNVPLPKFGTSP